MVTLITRKRLCLEKVNLGIWRRMSRRLTLSPLVGWIARERKTLIRSLKNLQGQKQKVLKMMLEQPILRRLKSSQFMKISRSKLRSLMG
ncbi:hypothetical protein DYL61_00425 [Pseudomonas nabeulensis]|uniref:Uncharacterized protein n=1 Tax=Pseudomonas nabeulensis TaxID=2293833 RepID=A0A4Z0BA68_9PSED|nr:hypothetical protein DYL61_00425 [Pseudomonas nabeulensis]